MGAVAALYFGAARLGLLMAFTHKNVSAVWPPSGFALAALLTLGNRIWPAISLGAFLANYSTGLSVPTALGICIGNTLEAVIGAYLLQRMDFRKHEGRLRDTLGLILLGGMASPVVAATLGVSSLRFGRFIGPEDWASAWWTWWLGDGMGILVATPVLLAWAAPVTSVRPHANPAQPWRMMEAAALLLALVGVTRYIVGAGKEYPYAVFPCLIWAAMRFGQRGATSGNLIVSGLAVWGTLHGSGPFVMGATEQSLEHLQAFMGVVSITTLILAAAMTERERGEQTQARLLDEVQRQRQRLNDILATVPAIVWEAYGKPDAANQQIDFVSDHIQTVLGYSVAEWTSRPNFWLDIVYPDDREQAARTATDAFIQGVPCSNRFRWISKDGRVLWTEAHSVTIHASDGRAVGMRGVNIDITEGKQAEEERERLVHELQRHQRDIEALNERLRRAVAETHHRVKNNLQVISALIELQETEGREQVSINELRRLGQHVRSLAVIHELLTREAKADADTGHIRIKEAMQRLMRLLQNVVGDRRLQFTVEDLSVSVRQGTALAVLVNELVSNAVKHGAGNIDLSLACLVSTAHLEVCDSGPGFPPEFDARKNAGTGMELIYSLSTWDLGGRVSFENRPEGGARVLVTFPIVGKGDEDGMLQHTAL